ncbi:hypothetical protein [Streptomyces sp. NPDC101165]|uniref:hypothetical protein n=1 Tax=Streptomyces sp. NPDC101165 TaxID=3366119 RepID=UPI0037F78D8A
MRPGDLPQGGGSLDDALGTGLTDVMRRTGAVIGGLYLIEESEPMLRLVALLRAARRVRPDLAAPAAHRPGPGRRRDP